MSQSTIRGMLWTYGLLIIVLFLLSLSSGCTSIGKSVLLPWNWKSPKTPMMNALDFEQDSQKVLGVKLTYKALQRLSFVVPVAFGAIVLGAIIMFAGHGWGSKILGSGFVGLTVYFGIVQYSQWIALMGFLGVIGVVAYIFYVKSRGWKQTVGSVQAVLEKFPDQAEEMIEILKNNQPDKATRTLNKKLKNSIKHVSPMTK